MIRWLGRAQAACERFADLGLSVLLGLQLVSIFVVAPLAADGITLPLTIAKALAVVVILMLVIGFPNRAAWVLAIVASVIRIAAGVVELIRPSLVTVALDAIGAALLLAVVTWIILQVVFAPGPITSHRLRGAVVLYLTIAILFAWVYLMIAALVPKAFSGLSFGPGDLGPFGQFMYYSLTVLTTVGFGDITPVAPFARDLSMAEALIGQLYPAIILGRLLTLYTSGRKRNR